MNRKLKEVIIGRPGVDGKVSLVHVLSRRNLKDADPLLLMDAFKSDDPGEYSAGFPMHPHRGIETISYVYSGSMVHKDSLGNEDAVSDGGVQWMTAGSGIFHEEMIPAVPHLLGVQIWLNLASKDKMAQPSYHNISDIREIPFDGGFVRLLAGQYENSKGFQSKYQAVTYLDVHIYPGSKFEMDLEEDRTLMLFALIGEAYVEDQLIPNFSAGLGEDKGDKVVIENRSDQEVSILLFTSKKIQEPVAWPTGPIVMNTQEEIDLAYQEIEDGTFLKDHIDMNA
ncbi:MAG: pirin family protein [Bacillota bacterium]|nr:pirin family protein [Bacillota bacterium]